MSRRPPTIRAIPTEYRGVMFRSRLESQWARMMDVLEWTWDYEPDLQVGSVIPDFLVSFPSRPVVLECKPAVTQSEVSERRRELVRKMGAWLSDDVLRELRVLDHDPMRTVEDVDRTLSDIGRVARGDNPTGHTRRVLVVGPVLFQQDRRVLVDDEHALCLCTGERSHVGLSRSLGDWCLYCGSPSTAWLSPDLATGAWREAGAAQQWHPRRSRRAR